MTVQYMLNYKELQQLLQPLQQSDDESPQPQHQKKQADPQSQKYSLNLSHRQLRKAPPLIPFKEYQIQQLNLSFNFLKDLKSFTQLSSAALQYLNLSFNFITTIDKLGNNFQNLRIIDLNANRIVSVDLGDKEFQVLEALYLKNNKIKYFLHCPNSVEILCLDHNQLEVLAFTGGSNIEILSASFNKIQDIEIENVQKLNFLDLQENKVSNIQKVKKLLEHAKNLLSLNMIGNYISKINHKKYLIEMLVTCPILVKVDQIIINPHVRQAFKVMKEEDKMQQKMKETQQKYRHRMQEQLRMKEELIDKLRQEQMGIEKKFQEFIKKQKQQLDVLENYAKNNMGKKIMGVVDQNKPFSKLANDYNKRPLEQFDQPSNNQSKLRSHLDYLPSDQDRNGQQSQQSQQQKAPQFPVDPAQLGNELSKYLVQGIIISKHKDEYNEYKKAKKQEQHSKQSKIKKYLGLDEDKKNSKLSNNNRNPNQNQKNNPNMYSDNGDGTDGGRDKDGDGFNDSMSDEDDQLTPQEKERRKKNMRNPGLVYRNSNQLIGAPVINIDEDLSSDEQYAFNKKCLPYLVKNYGFHTVI